MPVVSSLSLPRSADPAMRRPSVPSHEAGRRFVPSEPSADAIPGSGGGNAKIGLQSIPDTEPPAKPYPEATAGGFPRPAASGPPKEPTPEDENRTDLVAAPPEASIQPGPVLPDVLPLPGSEPAVAVPQAAVPGPAAGSVAAAAVMAGPAAGAAPALQAVTALPVAAEAVTEMPAAPVEGPAAGAGGAARAEKPGRSGAGEHAAAAPPVTEEGAALSGAAPAPRSAGAEAPLLPVAPVLPEPAAPKPLSAAEAARAPPGAAGDAALGAQGPAQPHGPTPLHAAPIEIGLRALAGARQFEIRLDPDELGRVEVRLEISDAGEVSARLTVDRVDTLHLLQRDARTLERAFEQAGLKPSDGGVAITLRDEGGQGFRERPQERDAERGSRRRRGQDAIEGVAAPALPASRPVRLGGVDLSV